MSANHFKTISITQKINISLISLFIFLIYSNFLTWKENVATPVVFDKSFIGKPIKNMMLQNFGSNFFSLEKDELINRISFSKNSQAYMVMPLITDSSAMGHVDEATKLASGWKLRGWTYVPESAGFPKLVIAVENGVIAGALKVEGTRHDVAKVLNNKKALITGYSGQIIIRSTIEGCNLELYTLTSSLKLFPMPSIC